MLMQWYLPANPQLAHRWATCMLGFFSMDVGHDLPLYTLPDLGLVLHALQECRQVYRVDHVVLWRGVALNARVEPLEAAVVEDPVARGVVTRIVNDIDLLAPRPTFPQLCEQNCFER